MAMLTNFRPEDMPGAKKKPTSRVKDAQVAETEAAQTAETDKKPATSRTSRKTAKGAQKPSSSES